MTNYEVIQSMTAKELAKLLSRSESINSVKEWDRWLRLDSQDKGGLLTDEMKKYWKVH